MLLRSYCAYDLSFDLRVFSFAQPSQITAPTFIPITLAMPAIKDMVVLVRSFFVKYRILINSFS